MGHRRGDGDGICEALDKVLCLVVDVLEEFCGGGHGVRSGEGEGVLSKETGDKIRSNHAVI